MFVRGLAAVAAAALVAVDVSAATAAASFGAAAQSSEVRPGTSDGAEPRQTGWWSRSNEPPPDTGLAAPPEAPEPTVPQGSLAVASVLGEPHKVAAVGLSLDGKPGEVVEELVLSLRESTADGVNAGAEEAVVLACPVTEAFWVPAQAGQWKHRPKHDCEAGSVTGVRKDGVWTFDLTSLAGSWLSPTHTGSRAVVLTGPPAAAEPEPGSAEPPSAPSGPPAAPSGPPASFQVVFDGPRADGIGVRAVFGPAPSGPPTDGVSDPAPGATGTSTGDDAAPAGGFGDVAAGVDGLDAPVADAGELPAGDLPPAATGTDAAPVAAEGDDAPALVSASPAAPAAWYSGLGLPALLMLVLGLGLAYLVMVAMGPDAQPVGGQGRRGVSRALDRMRSVGASLRGARS